MGNFDCCLNCEKRHPKCHSTCEDYAEYVRINEEKKATIKKIKNEHSEWYGHLLKTMDKNRKSKNKKRN